MANVTREIARITAAEQKRGNVTLDASWHNDYKDTSWIFAGNLSYKLSEGDVLAVFSEYGEIEDIHLVRDADTGESKGFCFLKYEDWRSTVLAVDNLNGATLLSRTIRVDHSRYERPKLKKDEEEQLSLEEKAALQQPGHAYRNTEKILTEGKFDITRGQNVFERPASKSAAYDSDSDSGGDRKRRKKRKRKKDEGAKERKHRKRKDRGSDKEGRKKKKKGKKRRKGEKGE